MGGWIILAILAALVFFAITIYNRLVASRNRFKNAFAQIDVQLTRRHDLIPNLVETAKGYMKHERETLEAVISARNAAVSGLKEATADPTNPEAMKRLAAAEQGLSGALGRLFALSEAYPDLKANENMMQLSEELTTTENRIQRARRFYNANVRDLNTRVEVFPSNLIASLFKFLPEQFFEVERSAIRRAVDVNFADQDPPAATEDGS